MTDNRTTELLRKLLDERGVKYSDFTSATRNGKAIFKTRWKHECGYAELSEWESTGSNNLFIQNVDPEQAIAATLGSGTCEQVLTDCDDGLIPPFTAHCSTCGAEWGFTPKYCHNCGAKVTGTRDERKAVKR